MERLKAAVVALAMSFAGCSSCTRGGELGDAAVAPAPAVDPPELTAKLEAALQAKGVAYVPRTRHKKPDGSPKFVNRLILETSPYLLQHAHNPVRWYAWGDEAFETARRLGRPVLLSVGYSTCHWCHVMEEESFEDEDVAAYLNANYVAIKVDREERPDVDAIYMSAVQALTGSGGWPMTVWLTPDRKPFYGGTYFPARDGDRGTRVGFLSLLRQLKTSYDENPSRIVERSGEIASGLQRRMRPEPTATAPSVALLDQAAQVYRGRFDDVAGGLRGAPKFPSSLPIRFLLHHHVRSKSADSLRMATLTLEKMAHAGIYDHVAGGFHRYSTDAQWLVPHFEKMLYDNALLVLAYLEGYQVTRRADFAVVAREILRYVERDMTSKDGAFYSATDADSLDASGRREEGWFFTWTDAELVKALGAERARVVSAHFGVTPRGNFEGRNILSVSKPAQPADAIAIGEAREILYRTRAERPLPGRDEKILTAWNGLMISAYAKAALTLHEVSYAERAERAADFILRELRVDGRLLRTFKDGRAAHAAYLDDHAFLIAGLLDLYEATGGVRWLEEAIRLDAEVEKHYEDATSGGCFFTRDDAEKLLARDKPGYDGAEPSGNSVQVLNLLRLGELTTKESYAKRAARTLAAFGGALASSPTSLSEMLLALDFATDVPKEIVIVTAGAHREAEPFLAKLSDTLLPNRIVVVASEGAELTRLEASVPLVASKRARQGKATAYVCEKGTCELPTTEPEVFASQLRKRR